uniref:nicotinate phosphoribosyltransferase n=1 Tax=Ditylum brightwellii TaxID=49249 RepID=A0A7S4R894_9STRA
MAYAYWKTKRHMEDSVFELFFRKNPFGGEYTIFCGLDEVLRHLSNFRFGKDDLDYLRGTPALKHCDAAFFDEYLADMDCAGVQVHAMKEGSVAFPRVPLVVVRGPLGVCQLLETTLLALINYPSLVATNAARMIVAATGRFTHFSSEDNLQHMEHASKKTPRCIEFGLRRAQGPDGGFSASKYSAVGGFDATSNVQAGKILGVPIAGTHAHAFVQAHSSLSDAQSFTLRDSNGKDVSLLERALHYRSQFQWDSTNDGELAAFLAYAVSFPDSFLCLIDTYDTLRSGLRNFIVVSLVLHDLGHMPRGIRLDSGDLSYLSLTVHRIFLQFATDHPDRSFFKDLDIVASNDINEEVLHSLNKQGHAITVFGIGTNLVTCQAQPALGCVYKLVEIDSKPRMKMSQDFEKVLIPGRKVAYRLFGEKGWPLLDLLVRQEEKDDIKAGKRILCRHPFIEQKRVAVVAKKVVELHALVFDGDAGGVVIEEPTLEETKQVRNMYY